MVASRLTLTNRPENLRLLQEFIQKWARDRNLPASRLNPLELAAGHIFKHLVDHAYQPDEPGSIAVELEEKGSRLRLMFEDDASSQSSQGIIYQVDSGALYPPVAPRPLNGLQHLAESLIYYRTADRKNRLVVFLH